MKNFLYNIFVFIALILVASFLMTFLIAIFARIFISHDSVVATEGFSAFLGAFMAYIFVRIGDAFRLITNRKREAFNSLVKLEHIGNDYLIVSSDIIFVAGDILNTINLNSSESPVLINFNVFSRFSIDNNQLMGLLNLDVLNKVYILNAHLLAINQSVSALEKNYSEINNGFIAKTLDKSYYIENLIGLAKQLELIIKFTKDAQEEIKNVLAIIRVVISKEKPIFTKLANPFLSSNSIKKYNKLIEKEKIVLDAEIESIRSTRQEEINAIVNSK
jgi:hypothetical protein